MRGLRRGCLDSCAFFFFFFFCVGWEKWEKGAEEKSQRLWEVKGCMRWRDGDVLFSR